MKKLRCITLFVAIFLFTTGFSYTEDKQRVFDYYGLLTEPEAEESEEVLKEQSIEDKVDYAFVSTNNLEGNSAKDYMASFITKQQMGYDKVGGDSAILLIDLQDKEVWVDISGTLDEIIVDADISNIVSDVLPYVQKSDFQGAIQVFAHNIHTRVDTQSAKATRLAASESSSSETSDSSDSSDLSSSVTEYETDKTQEDTLEMEEAGSSYEQEEEKDGLFSNPLTCLLIGAVLSGIVVFSMVQSGKSSMKAGADSYTTEARVNPYTKQDIFIRTVTRKTKKDSSKD